MLLQVTIIQYLSSVKIHLVNWKGWPMWPSVRLLGGSFFCKGGQNVCISLIGGGVTRSKNRILMRYFVSCKNWLMVQFIGYNVEGGSAYQRGGGYMDGWHDTSLSEGKLFTLKHTAIIFSRSWDLGGRECTHRFVFCQRVASPVFTQV